MLAKCPGSARSKVGWGQGADAPWAGCGSHMQHNTVLLGTGLSQPLSCWGLPSSQPQAPSFLIPGHLHLLLFLTVPGWHHPIVPHSPPQECPALSAKAQASRHGPRTAQSCPRDSLPRLAQHQAASLRRHTATVPAGPRCSAKHKRRGLHRSEGQHSPLAPLKPWADLPLPAGRARHGCTPWGQLG